MAQNVVDYNALAPNFSSVKDQIDMYGGGGSGSGKDEELRAQLAKEYGTSEDGYSYPAIVWHEGKLYSLNPGEEVNADDPWNESIWTEVYSFADEAISCADSIMRALAPNFDPTETYTVGTYVWRRSSYGGGNLYKCKTEHTGNWNKQHFTLVSGLLNAT